ncbi:uncharacterized protein PGTG_04352 [Puccinia graminis f. sp. tritici CRL 75-36-700-3]|uniref:Survival protein SurE-like phosphatase/nucleotidase domain-containing protein n=1 Tax=Puccinia graminis f. sp. tritici (strain CRL 75-36-700-3 / race SCCL) TaxID=418459 RepID=E3K227_PUCGT|nr:uncharacterized protein PGTG_04352 [Puccinia graminis f. sp. tritici CRL 75-36-700-3]EFP78396.1 hypothetical protein PGTG_04352 [Puccinia graminis f. sp. tritici CRL 75-36-700-3]
MIGIPILRPILGSGKCAKELESQNDEAIKGLSAKFRLLEEITVYRRLENKRRENTGLENQFSGTLGAASLGLRRGVAAITIPVDDENWHSYQSGYGKKSSEIYVNAMMRVIEELLKVEKTEGPNYLPAGCVLNINLQQAGPQTNCNRAQDYRFVLTTIFGSRHQCGIDLCGSHFLPSEQAVLDSQNGCWVPLIQSHSDPGAMSLLVCKSCGGLMNNEIVEFIVDRLKHIVVVQ